MNVTRRCFIKTGGAAVAGTMVVPPAVKIMSTLYKSLRM
jgi:hypothetical protein